MNRQLLDTAEKDERTLVVLYYLPDSPHEPYVTWIANKENPEATFWGHYFETLEDAEEDFERRSWTPERAYRLDDVLFKLTGGATLEKEMDREEFTRSMDVREEIRRKFRGS